MEEELRVYRVRGPIWKEIEEAKEVRNVLIFGSKPKRFSAKINRSRYMPSPTGIKILIIDMY